MTPYRLIGCLQTFRIYLISAYVLILCQNNVQQATLILYGKFQHDFCLSVLQFENWEWITFTKVCTSNVAVCRRIRDVTRRKWCEERIAWNVMLQHFIWLLYSADGSRLYSGLCEIKMAFLLFRPSWISVRFILLLLSTPFSYINFIASIPLSWCV